MQALAACEATTGSKISLEEVPEPSLRDGDLLVESLAVGVCGTDRGLVRRPLQLPAERDYLVIGHESLGRVLEAPAGCSFAVGDLVTAIVRRPDPVPCVFCAAGEPDLCANGRYSERGISGLDGFASERYRLESSYAVSVDPGLGLAGVLVEPASILAKAWERLDALAWRGAGSVLVLGAGPIGLLGAMMGLQRGYEVHVLDRVETGSKVELTRALGAHYHADLAALPDEFDLALECTGALVDEAIRRTRAAGVVCLISADLSGEDGWRPLGDVTRNLVIRNKSVIGVLNSNRRHFDTAHASLLAMDRRWLLGLLEPCVPLASWQQAFDLSPGQVKGVVLFGEVPLGPPSGHAPDQGERATIDLPQPSA